MVFREHFSRVVARTRPSLCVAWHQFFSFHYSLPPLLVELGVPLIFAEFGPLPGTIIFDRGGQMAESELATRSDEFARTAVLPSELDDAIAFLDRVRTERRTRKPQSSPGAVGAALRARGVGEATPVIFYAGQYDFRTGMRPRTLPNATLHSPFFDSTIDALGFLSELAKKNDWLILFKPHPLATDDATDLAHIPTPDRVITVPDASIFECIDSARAVTTIVSQTSYMALIHGKPCVMLGRNQLNGKGCAYEPVSRSEIEGSFRDAVARGFTVTQKASFERHVAQLLKTAVFGFDEGFAAPGLRGAEAAAGFLLSAMGSSPADLRRERHAAPRALYAVLRALDPVCAPLTWFSPRD